MGTAVAITCNGHGQAGIWQVRLLPEKSLLPQRKIKNKQTTFLIDLYKNYINLNVSNPVNSEVFKNLEILDNKICEKLNEEDQKLFRKWTEIQENYLVDTAEQAFIYGFCVYKQLENETKREGDKNE